jgi:predicted RNA-binding Zn-ribbon protein involved in translation (DUF1610 family)
MSIFKTHKKEKVEEVAPVETAPVAAEEPAEVVAKPLKTWVVNCSKCGAALNLKEGGQAYICPVCRTLLRVKTGVKLVKDLGAEDKKYHVTLTGAAMNAILTKEQKFGLEAVIAENAAAGYENGDLIVIDADETGALVKKA